MCAISLVRTAGPFSAQLEHLSYCELDLHYLDLLDFKLEQIRGQLEQLRQRYGKFDRFFHGAQVKVRGDPDLKLRFWGTLRSGVHQKIIGTQYAFRWGW